MRITLLPSILTSLVAIGGCATTNSDRADCSGDKCDIHGTDDRFEAHALNTPELERSARAVGALFREGALVDVGGGNMQVADARTYGEKLGLCEDVRFTEQVSGASCSGFLISSDVFVTAGHCLSALPCQSLNIVFDFANTEAGAPELIPQGNVYKCESVFFNPYQDGLNPTADIAIIRLARPVQDRQAMIIAESSPTTGDSVLGLGFPRGLPLKVSPASVQEGPFTEFWTRGRAMIDLYLEQVPELRQWTDFFVGEGLLYVDLDVYGGNSGGALVDATTGEVSGIVVREGYKATIVDESVEYVAAQELDYVLDPVDSCYRASVCGGSVECLNFPSAVPLTDYALELRAAIDGAESLDKDKDGLNDLREVAQGLDPNKIDSDGDSLSDAEEVGDIDAPVDSDNDGIIDALDEDSDADGISDLEEAGDEDPTTPAVDTDQDGLPDYLDLDSEGDTVNDDIDNCRLVVNYGQGDLDSDGQGDACDGDIDGDEVPDEADLCVSVADPEQADSDADGAGDACDNDIDGDGVNNADDVCVAIADSEQVDTDQDGTGDACDDDASDGDNCDGAEGGACDDGQPSGGCSVGSGSTSPWWPLLLAFFLIRKRRQA